MSKRYVRRVRIVSEFVEVFTLPENSKQMVYGNMQGAARHRVSGETSEVIDDWREMTSVEEALLGAGTSHPRGGLQFDRQPRLARCANFSDTHLSGVWNSDIRQLRTLTYGDR